MYYIIKKSLRQETLYGLNGLIKIQLSRFFCSDLAVDAVDFEA